jgi:hypothetical protein
MRPLPGTRRLLAPPVASHQGGWDEVLLFFGAPVTLFIVLRYLGIRRERREAAERGDEPDDQPDERQD